MTASFRFFCVQAALSARKRVGGDGNSGGAASLEDMLQMSKEDLAKALQEAQAKIVDLEAYTTELDGVTDQLQRQLEGSKAEAGADVEERLRAKDREIEALQVECDRMEREIVGMESADNDSAINYDALDKLDDELATAKEQLLLKDAEIARLKALEEAARREGDGAAQWRESAIQAQADHRSLKSEYEAKVEF